MMNDNNSRDGSGLEPAAKLAVGDSDSLDTNTKQNIAVPSAVRASASESTAMGGIFGYLLNNKLNASSNSNSDGNTNSSKKYARMKYHKFARGSSEGSFSDSDDDDNDASFSVENSSSNTGKVKDSKNNPIGRFPASSSGSTLFTRQSWFRSHSPIDQSIPVQNTDLLSGVNDAPPSTSWMSDVGGYAMQSVEKAKGWMFSANSNSESSILPSIPSFSSLPTVVPSLPNSVSSTFSSITSSISNYNLPFGNSSSIGSERNGASDSISNEFSATGHSAQSSTAVLPKLASRFSYLWATKHNPYQAVIGRDAEYFLSNTNPSYEGMFNMLHWMWFPSLSSFPWTNKSDSKQVDEGNSNSSNGEEISFKKNGRNCVQSRRDEKSGWGYEKRNRNTPSEASVQAVKNLLSLVEIQIPTRGLPPSTSSLSCVPEGIENSVGTRNGSVQDEQSVPGHSFGTKSSSSRQDDSKLPQNETSLSLMPSPPLLPVLSSTSHAPPASPFPDFEPFNANSPDSQNSSQSVKKEARQFSSAGSDEEGAVATNQSNIVDDLSSSANRSSIQDNMQHDPKHGRTSSLHANTSFDSVSSDYGNAPQMSPARNYGKEIIKSADTTHRSKESFQSVKATGNDACHTASHFTRSRDRTTSPENDKHNTALNAEMAARLSMGLLRALRDLALDEATELHSALHHWTLRWERPILGWIESGPTVWFSEEGYSPYVAGKKVSQIQAVLTRRCAAIGEMQQHLWRANWQRGIGEWGMLGGGVGGEWTAVVGVGSAGDHGGMDAGSTRDRNNTTDNVSAAPSPKISVMEIFRHPSVVGTNVSNRRGGQIVVDGGLAVWSIDAMRVIRDQLYRSGSGVKELPMVENWPREMRHFRGNDEENVNTTDLPVWAKEDGSLWTQSGSGSFGSHEALDCVGEKVSTSQTTSHRNRSLSFDEMAIARRSSSSICVTDLSTMASEVSALLQSIEIHLYQQRQRRLERLRPPSRLRRNWYLFAAGLPTALYVFYKLTKERGGFFLIGQVVSKLKDIYQDHVYEPLFSIYQELFTKSGRIDVTDRKARIDAIQSLKKMILSWLDESFPDMPVEEKMRRSDAMDISLIEQNMEESIKHIYEINSVVRMSLIEMQFIKKELMNALVAMDELMGSNEINMRIAAMTPAAILLIAIRRMFRLVFYALFQVGKSKEEVYTSIRQTVLDIERLLVMRDNPPSAPDPLPWGSNLLPARNDPHESKGYTQHKSPQTLSADDLGMVLLHIHECRNILWQNRRRFGNDVLRNVSEDLAELAGERGPVSINQQLQIISRMSRTYTFMKVISSGISFIQR